MPVQFRSNWSVDPRTGDYINSVPSPTGINGDPALSSYGVEQSKALAQELLRIRPPIDMIYSSPFYRCLQTLKPFIEEVDKEVGEPGSSTVNLEPGLGEWFGKAQFEHPQPASYVTLKEKHFSFVDNETDHGVKPHPRGEAIPQLHNRVARILHEIVEYEDKRPQQPRALLICTHAAVMIAIGRVLTGRMPADPNEDDFRCGTCSLSHYQRRFPLSLRGSSEGWKNGIGIGGGWDVVLNGDCTHLPGGEERTW